MSNKAGTSQPSRKSHQKKRNNPIAPRVSSNGNKLSIKDGEDEEKEDRNDVMEAGGVDGDGLDLETERDESLITPVTSWQTNSVASSQLQKNQLQQHSRANVRRRANANSCETSSNTPSSLDDEPEDEEDHDDEEDEETSTSYSHTGDINRSRQPAQAVGIATGASPVVLPVRKKKSQLVATAASGIRSAGSMASTPSSSPSSGFSRHDGLVGSGRTLKQSTSSSASSTSSDQFHQISGPRHRPTNSAITKSPSPPPVSSATHSIISVSSACPAFSSANPLGLGKPASPAPSDGSNSHEPWRQQNSRARGQHRTLALVPSNGPGQRSGRFLAASGSYYYHGQSQPLYHQHPHHQQPHKVGGPASGQVVSSSSSCSASSTSPPQPGWSTSGRYSTGGPVYSGSGSFSSSRGSQVGPLASIVAGSVGPGSYHHHQQQQPHNVHHHNLHGHSYHNFQHQLHHHNHASHHQRGSLGGGSVGGYQQRNSLSRYLTYHSSKLTTCQNSGSILSGSRIPCSEMDSRRDSAGSNECNELRSLSSPQPSAAEIGSNSAYESSLAWNKSVSFIFTINYIYIYIILLRQLITWFKNFARLLAA
ncbi:unnamed protein product [Protopolystoma xenopodis]|uniref:Uncharacterized protein n=1 Tax=Protopolystoma xenopodis TaxID=117903 RepID=A0A448XG04_9PLAT|nr:unnamed protein product [Protopolystoma xenopodis]